MPARKIGCGVCEEKSGVAGLRRSQILTAPGEWLSTRDELWGSSEYRALVAGEGAESTAHIDGRDIKVGVNPGLMAAMEQTIPLGHGGTPEEAAGAVYLFCIPESDYISGQTLICSGGLTGI